MIKAIFFDADGTLAIPRFLTDEKKIVPGFTLDKWQEYTASHEHPYELCQRSDQLFALMKIAKQKSVKIGVLSLAYNDNESSSKTRFINDKYSDGSGLYVDQDMVHYYNQDPEKISHMKRYADVNGLEYDQIMYIDDAHPTVALACAEGFEGHHISEFLREDFCTELVYRIATQ